MSEAKEVLEGAVETDPLAFELYFHLGCIHQSLGSPRESAREFRRVLFLERNFRLARYGLAQMLHLLKDYDAAIREYLRTEATTPEPGLRERFLELFSGLGEELWIEESHLHELCSANRTRAQASQGPLGFD